MIVVKVIVVRVCVCVDAGSDRAASSGEPEPHGTAGSAPSSI